jgi:2-C-methyl-D-erythritol 4-phosphate cytidylyltransferase
LCKEYAFDVKYMLANGGETRFHSVKNGLDMIPDDAEGVVGVHDGVRPFPALEVIERCYETAKETEAVIPVIPVVETLRHIVNVNCDSVAVNGVAVNSNSITVPRNDYRLVQTPQTFTVSLLKKAYMQPYNDNFTDDASVVEAMGRSITLVEGNRENIKITTPFDLTVAEALLNA